MSPEISCGFSLSNYLIFRQVKIGHRCEELSSNS